MASSNSDSSVVQLRLWGKVSSVASFVWLVNIQIEFVVGILFGQTQVAVHFIRAFTLAAAGCAFAQPFLHKV